MFGRAGRIGMIVPANNATIEPEVWPRLPAHTAVYATRILAKGDLTPAAVEAMEGNVERALEELAATVVDVVAYADMVTTFIMDPDWNDRRSAELARKAGVPVYTCWMALREALSRLGVTSFALATPYPASIHATCSPFFEARGYRVTGDATLDILAMTDVPKVDPRRVVDLVSRIDKAGADAIVLLATDLPTFEVIAEIERTTGLPVLTSNQTLLWHGLRICGNGAKVSGLGRLFDA
jgi:maleate isomerase